MNTTPTVKEAQIQNLKVWCRRFNVNVEATEIDRLNWYNADSVRGLPLGLILLAIAKAELAKIFTLYVKTETEIDLVSAMGAAAKMIIYEEDTRNFAHLFYQNIIESMHEEQAARILSVVCYITPALNTAFYNAVAQRGADQKHNANTITGMILAHARNPK